MRVISEEQNKVTKERKYRSLCRNNQKAISANEMNTRYYTSFRYSLRQAQTKIKTNAADEVGF